MKITDEVVDHIAHLARLEFIGNEKEEIKQDMEKIIAFMDKLNTVNTDSIKSKAISNDFFIPIATSIPNSNFRSSIIIRIVPKIPKQTSIYKMAIMYFMLLESAWICCLISGIISSQVFTS